MLPARIPRGFVMGWYLGGKNYQHMFGVQGEAGRLGVALRAESHMKPRGMDSLERNRVVQLQSSKRKILLARNERKRVSTYSGSRQGVCLKIEDVHPPLLK